MIQHASIMRALEVSSFITRRFCHLGSDGNVVSHIHIAFRFLYVNHLFSSLYKCRTFLDNFDKGKEALCTWRTYNVIWAYWVNGQIRLGNCKNADNCSIVDLDTDDVFMYNIYQPHSNRKIQQVNLTMRKIKLFIHWRSKNKHNYKICVTCVLGFRGILFPRKRPLCFKSQKATCISTTNIFQIIGYFFYQDNKTRIHTLSVVFCTIKHSVSTEKDWNK